MTTMLLILVAWTWTDVGGALCWTDDVKRVPAKYAEQATKVEIGPLIEYPRLTIDETRRPPQSGAWRNEYGRP